jgi:hypothetical protein
MKTVVCGQCQQTIPMNSAFQIQQNTFCESCAQSRLKETGAQAVKQGDIIKMIDPSICTRCNTDYGSSTLSVVGGGIPVCHTCEMQMRNYPFPAWIKSTLLVLLIIAAMVFVRNLRFFSGYINMIHGARAMESSRPTEAAAYFMRASEYIPEHKELQATSQYIKGISLMSEDRSTEALVCLQKASSVFASNEGFQQMLTSAEIGASYDNKDYDGFAAKAKAYAHKKSADSTAAAQYASALACQYAVSGDPKLKQAALQELKHAESLTKPDDPVFQEYQQRILFRLETRQILNRKQFYQQYPQGWKPAGGQS